MTCQPKVLNVAIVGGGPGCKAIMDMIFAEKLSQLRMELLGLACTNPKAVGYRYAQNKGIYTTRVYRDLYKLKDLNMIIELTGREEVADEIARTKPNHVRFMDHMAAHLFWDIFRIEEKRIAERKQAEEATKLAYAELNQIFETAADAMCVIDKDFNVLRVNNTFSALSGVSKDQTIGKKCHEVFQGSTCDTPYCPLNRIPGGEERIECEVEKERKDGIKIPCILVATPFRDPRGELVGIVECFKDITEHKQAEDELRASIEQMEIAYEQSIVYARQLNEQIAERKRVERAVRESEERYRRITEATTDYIFTVRVKDGHPVETVHSPACVAVTGYTPEDFASDPYLWIRMVHEEDRQSVQEQAGGILSRQHMPPIEHRILRKDGVIRWVTNTLVPNYDTQGNLLSYDGLIRDIHERKEAEEAKARLEIQLSHAQKMEAIGTLSGGIAHDFNNLLMGIQGNISLMLMDIDSTHPYYERLKNIEDQVQSGARLTSHLLGYARKGRYQTKPFNLNKLVKELSETFGRTRKEITIHQELATELFAVEGDQGQIEQVVLNLYVNAADAMPDGGDLILKTMNLTHKDIKGKLYDPKPGNYVLLMVADTGTGMDEKDIKRIFDPFFTTKEMGRGTGLGLASAYGIIKGHGGYIDVESEKGHGTTFRIYLPATEKKVETSVKTAEQIIVGTGTILLVDDEAMVLDVGVKVLERLGYTVLQAKGGREAVGVYEQNQDKIDMVILDMIMPDIGGGETYDKIKVINPNVKILLSSGYSIDGQAKEILARGCNGFIQKPFTMKELSQNMSKVLGKE